jgi:hypothetical protein
LQVLLPAANQLRWKCMSKAMHVQCHFLLQLELSLLSTFRLQAVMLECTEPHRCCVLAGPHCSLQQLPGALQQPSSARALEASIRCWAHLHATAPACLPEPHQDVLHCQRLSSALTSPVTAFTRPKAAAAAAARAAGLFASSDFFALCVTSLKAGVCSAGQAVAGLGTLDLSSNSSSSSSSRSAAARRVVLALFQATVAAEIAMTAHSNLAASSGSSSSSNLLQPAWQLLVAHSLHAVGSVVLAMHASWVPVRAQVADHRHEAVLQWAAKTLAWVRLQLTTMQQQAGTAAAAAGPEAVLQGSAQKKDPLLSLLQQQDSLQDSFGQLLTSGTSGSSSGGGGGRSSAWQGMFCADQYGRHARWRGPQPNHVAAGPHNRCQQRACAAAG